MSKRRDHLNAYVEGWRSMNVERVAGSRTGNQIERLLFELVKGSG